jgi:hypothetical protein
VVFFGFWLSHVPSAQFEAFWRLVDRALVEHGRVFFVDDGYRTAAELADGESSETIRRRSTTAANTGSSRRPTIHYCSRHGSALGWTVAVTQTSGPGSGTRQ